MQRFLVLTLLLGVLIWRDWPFSGEWVIGTFVGINLIFNGWSYLALGLHAGPHRHLDYDKAASAIFTEPEIADVGLAEAEAFAAGRKIRVTKVPFSATAKAQINNTPQGFVKIVSDPATSPCGES